MSGEQESSNLGRCDLCWCDLESGFHLQHCTPSFLREVERRAGASASQMLPSIIRAETARRRNPNTLNLCYWLRAILEVQP